MPPPPHPLPPPPPVWELPDVILFHVVSYVAPPTHRAAVLCQLSALCKASRTAIVLQEERPIWDIVLSEDYGAPSATQDDLHRRVPKRLRRSPIHRVRDAHVRIQDNTEIAFHYLTEMTVGNTCNSNSSGKSKKKQCLSKTRLLQLISEYGPHLRLHQTVSSGGLYLVELCRARHVKESVILHCLQALLERYGGQCRNSNNSNNNPHPQCSALLDLVTAESPRSRQTALCVAAVRAMPTVVRYLLQSGASPHVLSSGRFRLHTQPKKTISCTDVTPLQFCYAMRQAEREAGASERTLGDLNKCIRLLEEACQPNNNNTVNTTINNNATS